MAGPSHDRDAPEAGRVLYSAVVLPPRGRERLLEHFAGLVPPGWEAVGHHLTLSFGPNTPPEVREALGKSRTLVVTSVGRSDKAVALGVQSSLGSRNAVAHVTLAVNRKGGGKPQDSNAIAHWEPLPEPFRVGGTVREVTPRYLARERQRGGK